MKKYKLTEEYIIFNGKKLYRIEALRDFGNVKAGEWGGFVEGEKNLSHEGNCWVFGDAKVFGDAWVYGDAWVFGDAEVLGDAIVSGDAEVFGDPNIYNKTKVSNESKSSYPTRTTSPLECFFKINGYILGKHADGLAPQWVLDDLSKIENELTKNLGVKK